MSEPLPLKEGEGAVISDDHSECGLGAAVVWPLFATSEAQNGSAHILLTATEAAPSAVQKMHTASNTAPANPAMAHFESFF